MPSRSTAAFKRAIVIVLDGAGIGELPDAALRPRLLKLLHRRLDRLEGSVVR